MQFLRERGRWVLMLAATTVALVAAPPPTYADEVYNCPDWYITLSDYGYSDFLIYEAGEFPAFELHEMISGEWAAAIGYDGVPLTLPEKSMWLTPEFLYPDWFSNSTFTVVEPISPPLDTDADGLPEGYSVIENGDVRIRIEYDFEDTITGTPIAVGGGAHVLSDRYVLLQRYVVTNLKSTTLTNLRFYQFLHGHPANDETANVQAVYDTTFHAGAGDAYRYDTTNYSTNSGAVDGSDTGFLFEDHISFSSPDPPDANGLGHYRDHISRPTTGLHVDVEQDTLGNETTFGPDEVAGAERWMLSSLGPGASYSFDVQLAVRSETLVTPSVECVACLLIDPGSQDPDIRLSKGACGAANPGGPFDVLSGKLAEAITSPDSDVLLFNSTCEADELMADRITVSAMLEPLAPRYILVRHGTFAQTDYGGTTSGNVRIDIGFSCP